MNGWYKQLTFTLLAALLILAHAAPSKKKVSDYFRLCRENDPQLSECVKNTIQESRDLLAKGIPDLKMPPLDPMQIPEMELREGQGNFLFILKMTNMNITGLKEFVVKSVEGDVRSGKWRLIIFTPRLQFEADYEMRGKLLALPIQGNGRCTFDFKGVTTTTNTNHHNVTRNGKVYSQVDDVKWDISVEHGQSHFSNLFNGDKTLGNTTNQFLNQNWKEAFETYKHLPEEAFGQVFLDLDNRFFGQFSVDELYLK